MNTNKTNRSYISLISVVSILLAPSYASLNAATADVGVGNIIVSGTNPTATGTDNVAGDDASDDNTTVVGSGNSATSLDATAVGANN